jgi:hypothetical protein
MKKAILIVVAVPVVAWCVLAILAVSMERSAVARPWPNGLGGLDSVAARYPERAAATPAAVALTRLTVPLGVDITPRADRKPGMPPPSRKDFDAIKMPLHDYLTKQVERPSTAIDDAPPAVAAYFDAHRAQLDAVRAHILSGAPIAWTVQLQRGLDMPIPNLLGHMELARLFVTDALMKAKHGDAAAWDDLHAVWQLDAGLRPRPDLISQLIALASTRMTNAAAAKLPLPAPAWLAEVQAFDYRRGIVASMQSEANSWLRFRGEGGVRGFIAGPYIRVSAADAAEHVRTAFVDMAKSNACDVDEDALMQAVKRSIPKWNLLANMGIPNISSLWQRVVRVTPEIELTEKVLQLRRGEMPPATSRCSDGQWLVTRATVKFSRTLREPKTGTHYPLEFAALDLGH